MATDVLDGRPGLVLAQGVTFDAGAKALQPLLARAGRGEGAPRVARLLRVDARSLLRFSRCGFGRASSNGAFQERLLSTCASRGRTASGSVGGAEANN